MPTYVAMLRGINVSGQKIIKMEALRASMASLGFADVKTYVQSGNIIFKTAKASTTVLVKKIAGKILADFGHTVSVLVRTPQELADTLKHNALLAEPGVDEARLYVTFLAEAAPENAEMLLKPLATASEKFCIRGREIYLHCPAGYGNSKFSNNAIEKKLSAQATTRNWRTTIALCELAQL